jgi:hypothetical protein
MYVTKNETAAPISLSPPRALENLEARNPADGRVRRRPKRADTRRAGAPRGRARDPAAKRQPMRRRSGIGSFRTRVTRISQGGACLG